MIEIKLIIVDECTGGRHGYGHFGGDREPYIRYMFSYIAYTNNIEQLPFEAEDIIEAKCNENREEIFWFWEDEYHEYDCSGKRPLINYTFNICKHLNSLYQDNGFHFSVGDIEDCKQRVTTDSYQSAPLSPKQSYIKESRQLLRRNETTISEIETVIKQQIAELEHALASKIHKITEESRCHLLELIVENISRGFQNGNLSIKELADYELTPEDISVDLINSKFDFSYPLAQALATNNIYAIKKLVKSKVYKVADYGQLAIKDLKSTYKLIIDKLSNCDFDTLMSFIDVSLEQNMFSHNRISIDDVYEIRLFSPDNYYSHAYKLIEQLNYSPIPYISLCIINLAIGSTELSCDILKAICCFIANDKSLKSRDTRKCPWRGLTKQCHDSIHVELQVADSSELRSETFEL